MGLLKRNKTIIIAVWGSIILHTAALAGFGLFFPDKKKVFPESVSRSITLLSIGNNPGTEKKPVQKKTAEPLSQKPLPSPVRKQKQQPKPRTKEQGKVLSGKEEKAPPVPALHTDKGSAPSASLSGGAADKKEGAPAATEAVPVTKIRPAYPFIARKRGIEGTVLLNALISKEGIVEKCTVIRTSGNTALDRAAVKAVMHSAFYPATTDGKTAKSTLKIEIQFKLEN